uniref:Uncharacterized protein n=1 Tax=Arundo donax TaxID=35708 RepID=A0A0A9AI40_ARUDO
MELHGSQSLISGLDTINLDYWKLMKLKQLFKHIRDIMNSESCLMAYAMLLQPFKMP